MTAGGSAGRRAAEARRQERELREQWLAARQRAWRWEAASKGEQRIAAQLLVLVQRGWRLLVDRRWPGTRSANVDMLLVGPGGVFVIDVKNWRSAPETGSGRLRAGGEDRHEEIDRLLAVTRTTERAVEELGLSPVAVHPVMAFAGRRLHSTLGRVRLVGEYEVGAALAAQRARIGAAAVGLVAGHLEKVFTAYEDSTVEAGAASPRGPGSAPGPSGRPLPGHTPSAAAAAAPPPSGRGFTPAGRGGGGEKTVADTGAAPATGAAPPAGAVPAPVAREPAPGQPEPGQPEPAAPAERPASHAARPAPGTATVAEGDDGLFDLGGLRDAVVDAARQGPIERWMTFLDAAQIPLVRRNWAGPARISGPAGTGKTVVGLHRAAHLAQRTTKRVLYVTFANNLPRVQSTFLRTMSPEVADRIDFRSVHAWAGEFLRERGVTTRLHGEKAQTAFSLAWARVGRGSRLAEIDPAPHYWREEIDYVIKGRGITAFEEYAALRRRRRLTVLRRPHREAVWALYEEYERRRREKDVHDFNDVLLLARDEARARPELSPYGAVVVDEIQDLTLVGVQMLHALVGDVSNGLLLIGDGQQAVYPGGFRLSDAGVDIRGDRGQVLRTNYRNAGEILEAALEVVADDQFEDIDGSRSPGRRDIDLTYHDGRVIRVAERSLGDHDQALLTALRAQGGSDGGGAGRGWGDIAVLCPSRRDIERYHRLLDRAEIPVCTLENYTGRPVDAVKLGSYRRAKGLEFKYVFLPCHDAALPGAPHAGPEGNDVVREREELARSQLFVAMTRARDTLWLGSVAPPTPTATSTATTSEDSP
ncbi:UvrD-helicase domain-containing protein [Streptomyces sp. P1-3]|uniref:nuclease-related domain-containing DEAD/DEAH box helicase n=1 Tax=Streptomyces sp. P1-3 TaxID=3421658 RepID=UPI003D36D08B